MRELAPPSTVVGLYARPQRTFRPTHFVVHAYDAPYFHIEDVQVGNRSAFPAPGGAPAIAFACVVEPDPELRLCLSINPIGKSLENLNVSVTSEGTDRLPEACTAFIWETAQVAMDIAAYVRNTSNEPRRFRAWVLGRHVDEPSFGTMSWPQGPGTLVPWPVGTPAPGPSPIPDAQGDTPIPQGGTDEQMIDGDPTTNEAP